MNKLPCIPIDLIGHGIHSVNDIIIIETCGV